MMNDECAFTRSFYYSLFFLHLAASGRRDLRIDVLFTIYLF